MALSGLGVPRICSFFVCPERVASWDGTATRYLLVNVFYMIEKE